MSRQNLQFTIFNLQFLLFFLVLLFGPKPKEVFACIKPAAPTNVTYLHVDGSTSTTNTNVSLTPNFGWTVSSWGDSAGSGDCAYIYNYSGGVCAGSAFAITCPNRSPYTSVNFSDFSYISGGGALAPLTANTTYCFNAGAYNACGSTFNATAPFTTGNPQYAPTIASTTINTTPVTPDGAASYTISAASSDQNGVNDITQQQVLVNTTAYRGYLAWFSNPAAAGSAWSLNGNCGKYIGTTGFTAFGSQYLNLTGCTTSTTGNTRTTVFSVSFNPAFIAPVANTLYGLAYDSTGNVSNSGNWTAGGNFNIVELSCTPASNGHQPPSALPTGLTNWWRLDETAGSLAGDSAGGNDVFGASSLYNNLVSWWKLDDAAANSAVDSKGTNNGTGSGLGCNFANAGGYNNTLNANLVSYWKLDEPTFQGSSCDFSYLNSSLSSGKVGYWSLDETSGTTAADQWSGYNGTIAGTTSTTGRVGTARNFATTYNDYITVADQPNLRLNATTGLTATAWIYPTSYTAGNYNEILDKDGNYLLRLNDNGTVSCWLGLNGTYNFVVNSTTTAPLNTWTHVGCTWDGGTAKIYLNAGTPVSNAAPVSGSIGTTAALWIGASYYGSTFKGKIDEVTIWNRALSGTELGLLYGSGNGVACTAPSNAYADALGNNPAATANTCPSGQISYWNMDETSGSTIADKVGTNTGTGYGGSCDFAYLNSSLATGKVSYWKLDEASGAVAADQWSGYNGTITGTTSTTGRVGSARNFANTYNDYITIADNANIRLSSTHGFTATAWIYPTSYTAGNYNEIIDKDKDYILRLQPNGTVTCYLGLNGNFNFSVTSTATAPLNTWTHVGCTWDGSTGKIYVNAGTPVSAGGTASGTIGTNATALWIGAAFYGSTFKGRVDEVTLWSKALSATEVGLLYNSGSGVNCQSPGPAIVGGKFNNGRNLNGTNNYYNAPLGTYFGNNNALSVVAWVNVTATTNGPIFGVTQTPPGGGWNMPFLSINGTTIYGWIWNVNGNTPLSYVTTTGWHHVAITYSPSGSGQEILYVDGIQRASGTGQYSPAGTAVYWTNYISGSKPSGVGAYLSGTIDEVGIWNRALSAGEVGNLASATSGCGSGLTATTGKINGAQTFNGTNNYLGINNVNPFRSNFTVSTWVKFTSINRSGNDNTIVANGIISGNNTDNLLHLVERGGKFYFGFYNDDLAGNTNLSTGVWYHVAFVYDGGKKIYVNGNLDAQGGSGTYQSTALNTQIGHSPWAAADNSNLAGALDELAIWGRALSSTEISQMANYPSGRSCDAGPVTTTGKIGYSGDYSRGLGGNDQILVPDSNSLDITTGGISLAAWFKANDLSGNKTIIGKRNDVAANKGNYALRTVSNQLSFYWWSGSAWQVYQTTNANLSPSTWYHVAATFDNASTVKIYLNGGLLTGSCVSGTCNVGLTADTNPLAIGWTGSTAGEHFVGAIDEVGIWNRPLVLAEVNQLYQNGLNGTTYVSGTAGGPSIVSGGGVNLPTGYPVLGNARSFNGGGDYLLNSSPVGLPTGSVMSVTAWVKPTGTYADTTYNGVVSFGPRSGNNSFLLALQNTGKPAFAAFGNDFVPTQGNVPAVVANQWNHLAAVLSGNSITLYVNGVAASGTLASTPNVASGPLAIGETDNPGRFFSGQIDEVRIYNRALQQADITNEYARGGVVSTGSCGSGSGTCGALTQPYLDTYCSAISQTCYQAGYVNITNGSVMSIPTTATTVNVTATPPSGSTTYTATTVAPSESNPNPPTNIVGANTYFFNQLPWQTTYTLHVTPITGYSVNPQDYALSLACQDAQGPTFWYDNDAGIVSQTSVAQPNYYGSGAISQSGGYPGYRLDNYPNAAPISAVSYDNLLGQLNKNLGLSGNPCTAANSGNNYTVSVAGLGTLLCYNDAASGPTRFETQLRAATTSATTSPNIIVIYPDQGVTSWTFKSLIAQPFTIPANKTILAFVPASFDIQQNITVTGNSGLMIVQKASSASNPDLQGNLYVDRPVTRLDGVYVFPGTLNDAYGTTGSTSIQLVGYGSLLGIGNSTLGLNRTIGPAIPAEEWHFQAKYLKLYQPFLSGIRFNWKELPPQ